MERAAGLSKEEPVAMALRVGKLIPKTKDSRVREAVPCGLLSIHLLVKEIIV